MKTYRPNRNCPITFPPCSLIQNLSAAAAVIALSFALLPITRLLALDLDPRLVGTYVTNGAALDVAVCGHYAHIVGAAGLVVIDISDPANPQRVGGYPLMGQHLAVSGNYAYVIDFWEGLRVIDISDPADPRRVGGYGNGDYVLDVAVSASYAYVLERSWATGTNYLQVIDISNPANPQRVASCVILPPSSSLGDEVYAHRVAVSGNHAYVTQGFERQYGADGALEVIDISNPANPHRVGGYVTSGDATGVTISGNYAYVAEVFWGCEGEPGCSIVGAGLQVIDITDPASPQRVGWLRLPVQYNVRPAFDVAVSGKYACVALSYSGLVVIDISDPANPQRVGGYDTTGSAQGVEVCGNHAYVADDEAGLQVVDISNRANPQRVGGYDIGDAFQVTISGNYAYVADRRTWPGGGGFEVIDISNPGNPQRVGRYVITSYITDVTVSGNFAYLAAVPRSDGTNFVEGGLHVIDISNPTLPQRVGGCLTGVPAFRLALSGNYVYLAAIWYINNGSDLTGRLHVIDISNPTNPQPVGGYTTIANDVAVSGTYAYVAAGSLQVINISNPTNPQPAARYDTKGWLYGLPVSTNFTYTRDGDSAWQVIDVSDPVNPKPVGPYDTIASVFGVAMSGNYAYVPGTGLQVIDISNPGNPRRVGGNTSFSPNTVTVANGKVFAAASQDGFVILHEYQPIRFEQIARQNNGAMRLRIAGPPGVPGRVQRSADFRTWTDWLPINFVENPIEVSDPDTASTAKRFYRLAVP